MSIEELNRHLDGGCLILHYCSLQAFRPVCKIALVPDEKSLSVHDWICEVEEHHFQSLISDRKLFLLPKPDITISIYKKR